MPENPAKGTPEPAALALVAEHMRYAVFRWTSSVKHWVQTRFTPAGWLVLSGLTASAVWGVDTNQTVAYQAFPFLAALVAMSMLSSLFFRGSFEVRRKLPRFGTAGEPLPYSLEIRNLGSAPERGLSVSEALPDPRPTLEEFISARTRDDARLPWYDRGVGFTRWRRAVQAKREALAEEAALPDLPPGGTFALSAALRPLRRGRLRLDTLAVSRPDPLGVFKAFLRPAAAAPGAPSAPGTAAAENISAADSVLILPRRYPVPRLALPGARRYQHGGVALSSSVGDSQEFIGLRDYRPGDPLRRIHWKSWPRVGKPIVKEYQDEYFVRHALVLDTFAERGRVFEEAVSVAASFACAVLTQESLLDLLFIGAEAFCFTAGRGLGGADRMLEILACVEPCRDKDFSELEGSVLRRRARLSGCILVLPALDDARLGFLRRLRGLGVPTLAVVVEDPPRPDLESPEGGTVARPAEGVRRLQVGRIAEGLARI